MKLYNDCDVLDGKPCIACKDYMDLENKISAARQALDDLLALQFTARTKMNQSHDPITRELPPEVISSIFQFSVPDEWEFDILDMDLGTTEFRDTEERMVFGPLFLGAVCKAWRNIAWGSPSLWATMRLLLDRPDNHNHISLAWEWLDRARQTPLSIRISCPLLYDRGPNGPREIASRLIPIINEHSHQWENLDIIGPYWLISNINGGLQGAPNMRRLRISYHSILPGDHKKNQFCLLSDSKPRPSHISLGRCRLNWIHIEWYHLTRIFASDLCLDECIEVLRRASLLVYCTFFSISISWGIFPNPVEPIIHQALESLEFSTLENYTEPQDYHTRIIMPFLANFTFPRLKHLMINYIESEEEQQSQASWDPVAALISRSSPPLISLGVQRYGTGVHPVSENLLPILQETPSLRSLHIMAPFGDECRDERNNFFHLLADTSVLSTQKVFLPCLQTIEFRLCISHEVDTFWEYVLEIFGPISDIGDPSRRPLNTLRVRIEIYYKVESYEIKSREVAQRLLDLEREGITFDLKDVDMEVDFFKKCMERHRLSH